MKSKQNPVRWNFFLSTPANEMISKGPIRQNIVIIRKKDSIRLRTDWLPLILSLNYFLSMFSQIPSDSFMSSQIEKEVRGCLQTRGKQCPTKLAIILVDRKPYCLSSRTQFSTWSSYSREAEAERKGEELKPRAGQKLSTL